MKQIRVVLTCDEYYVADTLREVATMIEDGEQSWYEAGHGSGFTEEVDVPDPQPSLDEMFDEAASAEQRKREDKHRKQLAMQDEERKWIEDTMPKFEFLKDRGFTVTKYFGGLIDGWPYNYIRIEKRNAMNCWVEIMGATVRREDGTLDHLSPIIYNTEVLTMEKLIKKIAEW